MKVAASAFKAYDIRGIVGQALDEQFAEHLGRAFGTEARQAGEKAVAVGRDGRLSGPGLAAALMRGLASTGLDVVDQTTEFPGGGLLSDDALRIFWVRADAETQSVERDRGLHDGRRRAFEGQAGPAAASRLPRSRRGRPEGALRCRLLGRTRRGPRGRRAGSDPRPRSLRPA